MQSLKAHRSLSFCHQELLENPWRSKKLSKSFLTTIFSVQDVSNGFESHGIHLRNHVFEGYMERVRCTESDKQHRGLQYRVIQIG